MYGLSMRNKELLEDEIELLRNNPTIEFDAPALKRSISGAVRTIAKQHADTYA